MMRKTGSSKSSKAWSWIALLLVAGLLLGACGGSEPEAIDTGSEEADFGAADEETCAEEEVETDSGLRYVDEKCGDGDTAASGDVISVHYLGTLENGKKFDASRDHGSPFQFQLGAGNVIAGWDEGVQGMQEGGIRILTIPPELAYGETGAPPTIPPNATLVFEVELLEIVQPGS